MGISLPFNHRLDSPKPLSIDLVGASYSAQSQLHPCLPSTNMPGEVIDRPNPKALKSLIPEDVLKLSVQLEKVQLSDADLKGLEELRTASNYIAAAMIFLSDNALLERDLTFDDIKPRLLGHWGTCPGLTLVYAHLNFLTRKNDLDCIYVVGPGHGAPAILASLWLEGSLEKFYPQYAQNKQGLHNLITGFSTPHGFPSHINAETPGAIHEGGELGYALSVAFGAVMDKPDLIVGCIVGDGEAESGPTATAWHAAKYIDPAESGAVIPIVHVNGFKISERTIYGCLHDKELVTLFTGYGYQCRFVEDLEDIDRDLATSFQWALDEIRKIQKAARSGNPIMKPRWPVIIMRTPKGWSGPKIVDGEFVEGSFHAHQVPLMAAKTNKDQLADLQKWLLSYGPAKLFTETGDVTDSIKSVIPIDAHNKLGQRAETYKAHEPLKVPDWRKYGVEKGTEESCMKAIGNLIDQALVDNPKSLRIFSPDELVSNKLDAVFNHTGRDFQWDEFSHQNPSFIGAVLNLKPDAARVYFPPDANTFLSTVAHCLRSKNYVNLMVGSKQPQPVFLSTEEADAHCQAGASIWKFASTDDGLNPDVTLVGIGSELMFEVVVAASILHRKCPALRVRVVNVTDLMILEDETLHPHSLTNDEFNSLFTPDRPIHFNYHIIEAAIKGLLFGRPNLDRISIECYKEEGSTTTPFDMMLRNNVSRYHIIEAAIKAGAKHNH